MAIRLLAATRNAAADAIVDLLDAGAGAGTLKIYTGSQPATAATAPSGTLLATVTLADPAFGGAAAGVATASAIATVQGVASGDAGWFRAADSTGTTVHDGSVTASGGGGDLTLDNITIASGQDVSITAYTVTIPSGE